MATARVSKTAVLPASFDRVALALCSEAVTVAAQYSRKGVISATYSEVVRSDSRVVVDVLCKEHVRKKTGALDRSTLMSSSIRTTWLRANRHIDWTYEPERGRAVQLSGRYELHEVDGGTWVRHTVSVVVHLPVVGGPIAKIVTSQIERDMPRHERLLREHLARQSPNAVGGV